MSSLKTIRTDVVGSLLRPAAVKEARTAFDDGKDRPPRRCAAIEDQAVRAAVAIAGSGWASMW